MNRYHGMNVWPILKPLGAEERADRRVARSGPRCRRGEPDEGEHQADRDDELRDERRVGEPPHEEPLDQRAEERRGDEHGEREREQRLDARG